MPNICRVLLVKLVVDRYLLDFFVRRANTSRLRKLSERLQNRACTNDIHISRLAVDNLWPDLTWPARWWCAADFLLSLARPLMNIRHWLMGLRLPRKPKPTRVSPCSKSLVLRGMNKTMDGWFEYCYPSQIVQRETFYHLHSSNTCHPHFHYFSSFLRRSQVVAGTNFLMKIQVSEASDGFIHVKIFRPLPHTRQPAELHEHSDIDVGKTLADPIDIWCHFVCEGVLMEVDCQCDQLIRSTKVTSSEAYEIKNIPRWYQWYTDNNMGAFSGL